MINFSAVEMHFRIENGFKFAQTAKQNVYFILEYPLQKVAHEMLQEEISVFLKSNCFPLWPRNLNASV
jgi:hypothetical protein